MPSTRDDPHGGDADPITASLKSSFDGFSDIPIPALDERIPCAAATDPITRPRLIELMKSQVHLVDQQRRSQGVDFDINPLLKALGLVEIIQPPSPCGGVIWDRTKELRTPIRRPMVSR